MTRTLLIFALCAAQCFGAQYSVTLPAPLNAGDTLTLIAPEAAALIGKRMDIGAEDSARDDANRANRDAQILQFLEGLSKRLSKIEGAQPKPASPPADSPLVDAVTLPEVAP